jgi:polyisoprenoid-binding protein YceI
MKRTASVVAALTLSLTIASAQGLTTPAAPSERSDRARAAESPSPGWPIDRAHSRVTFTVVKWGFAEVEGRFLDFAGTLFYDATHPERSNVDWRVRIASVETGAPNRDQALQSTEYFDAARYPEMRFVSDQVTPLPDQRIQVQGRLTIRGQTRPLTVTVACGGNHDVPGEGTFEIFQTEFTLNRYDFGVVGGSILGPAISRDVHVKIIGAVNHR